MRLLCYTQQPRSRDTYSYIRCHSESKADLLVDRFKGLIYGLSQAFYLPNKHRPNFTVLVSAQVSRVVTESSGGKVVATGVEFIHDGTKHVVNVGKEVLVCAGYVSVQRTMH